MHFQKFKVKIISLLKVKYRDAGFFFVFLGYGRPQMYPNYPPPASNQAGGPPPGPYEARPVGNHLPPGQGPGGPHPPQPYPGYQYANPVSYPEKRFTCFSRSELSLML